MVTNFAATKFTILICLFELTLFYAANMMILMIFYDLCLLPAEYDHIYWKAESNIGLDCLQLSCMAPKENTASNHSSTVA
jgi:hypothetical protein